MRHPGSTLFDMDWQGVVLLRVVLSTHLWDGHSQISTNPLAEEAEVARVVVTLMGPAPLGEDVRKRMDFQVNPNSRIWRQEGPCS